nr:MAG TPA: PsbA, PsbB, PsbC, PsbD, PsbE-FCP supercomplex, PLANT PROTEIN [Caudoviricetes sp.]
MKLHCFNWLLRLISLFAFHFLPGRKKRKLYKC